MALDLGVGVLDLGFKGFGFTGFQPGGLLVPTTFQSMELNHESIHGWELGFRV